MWFQPIRKRLVNRDRHLENENTPRLKKNKSACLQDH